MRIAAITGSIGCGKSTLADIVRDLGYVVFDIDGWVRQFYYKKDFLEELFEIFPESFKDGKLDKRYLRNLVFNDSKKLELLENLIYPFLQRKLRRVCHRYADNNKWFFLDIALLFEKGWDKYCDFIILADVEYDIQKKRVMERDNIKAEDFDKINNIQLQNDTKKLLSDIVIDTNKPINNLRKELISVIVGLESF